MTFERAGVLSADLTLFSEFFPSEPSKTVLTLWKKFLGVCHFAEPDVRWQLFSKKNHFHFKILPNLAGCITIKFYNCRNKEDIYYRSERRQVK